ncbi:MAG: hypothetical protein A3F18_08800 [Legionellales bacterium RIFCSPHIGHO2_12_FULL_37_14]|nr:MAG: hypothetical protein A3F18_08800 [Legionellales bacterium RIFCSPHIGHO2_12_FULL_37_14]
MNSSIKNKIRTKFNRAAKTYDLHCIIQNAICQRSIQLLLSHQNSFKHVADFACGTGESTLYLQQHINFKKCYAVDFAEQLLTVAQNKVTNINHIDWIHSDFEHPLHVPHKLDLIFCNMGLQWSNDFSTTLCLWQQYLDKNGLLLFSIPIAGNFPEIKKNCKPTLLDHQQIINWLSENHWQHVTNEVDFFEKEFKSPIEALKSLKATGANYCKNNIRQASGLSPINLNEIFLCLNNHKLTYKIGIYLVRNIL